MMAIYKRELKGYFQSFTGYVFCSFILLFEGIYIISFNLKQGYANFEYTLSYLSFILILAVPFVTMKTFAEEKKQKTDRLLYSLPLSMCQIVIGKYLALVSLMLLPCLIMAVYPLLLSQFGNVNLKIAYGTLIGFFFLSSSLLAVGMMISSLCESQATAAGISFLVFLLLYYGDDLSSFVTSSVKGVLLVFGFFMLIIGACVYYATKKKILALAVVALGELICLVFAVFNRAEFSQLLVQIIKKTAVFSCFFTFIDGVFNIAVLFYFLSISAICICLNIGIMENRRLVG